MADLRNLKSQLQTTESIKDLTQSLSDIATSKLKAVRASAEQNVRFFREISEVYKTVKLLAEKTPVKSKKLIDLLAGHKNGRTVFVLITSNSNFYGGLDREIVQLFIEKTKNVEGDKIVVGTTGDKILKEKRYPDKYEFIKLKKDYADPLELQAMSKRVFEYNSVIVYYTKFVTLLDQQPTFTNISGAADTTILDKLKTYYILEPEIDNILEFFEGQILVLLIQSIFIDVQIAHLAARMISMNEAENNANLTITKEKKQIIRTIKQLADRESLNVFSSLFKL